ncbi:MULTISPECIES: oligoendopeptidase F [unclassified Haladaptatus]|uniref:oligoendopeptidase F n=1 Tax=unclassified Haladaptatus TaxID=2622732 RepID=UPI0023E80ED7|nr:MULTISPECIES: oligoendopeptidase F [unclassified Haladaptatus]
MSSVPERSEISAEHKWDLDSLYASVDEWETAYEEAESQIEDLEEYEGQVTDDAETLLSILQLEEAVMRRVSNVASYARMRRDEDTRDQDAQALLGKAQTLVSKASSASSYIEPELQQSTRDQLQAFVETEPELATYEHYFDEVLRMKPHTRSAEVENLLAELGEVTGASGEIYNMLTNADLTFPSVDHDGEEVTITQSNFTKLQQEQDRDLRRKVYETFYGEWETIRNAVGSSYKNSVKADVKLSRARNYDSAREAALDSANIPVDVYDNLLSVVRDNLDLLHQHAELKRDSLGVDDLQMWDIYMPMVNSESPEIPYEDAREYIVEAVAPLGEDYQNRLARGLDSRWVDVYENKGKQSGAYSGGTYDSQPFILMNYQDDLSSLFTLAHELGHSLHSEYTSDTQPYVYSGYEIFVAEVASTVNESLLTHHLLETVEDENLRRHILNEYLERFRSTLYRQTMFADFEHQTHQLVENGEPLTPDRLDGLYRDLKKEFYEPAVVDDHIAREWMRIPHFYRAFYVYQYSTGISAAVALTEGILERGEPAANDYIEFLRGGSSTYPLELLRGAGVDMASPEPVESALSVYGQYLDEFAQLQ